MDHPDLSSGICIQIGAELWTQPDVLSRAKAKQICTTCPVVAACLEWALTFDLSEQHGVVGGTYARQRQQMIKQQLAS